MLEIGKSYTIEQVVTPEMTARAIGSGGLEVFGTPFMMAMMEHAAMDCVQPDLPEGKGTVGVDIQSSHLAPTPVGMTVRATATVTGVSENGKLITFRVEASDDWGPIGEGTHTRAVIANDRFLQKCNGCRIFFYRIYLSLCCTKRHLNRNRTCARSNIIDNRIRRKLQM